MSIEQVAVIGCGLMGHGIAQVAAMAGQTVALIDKSEDALAFAKQKIGDSLTRLADKGRIKETPEAVLGRIRTTSSLADGLRDAQFVIEAVFEEINLKRNLIAEVEALAPKDTILATNTSGLSIRAISGKVRNKAKVIGMHWMNPPQLMKLVELIRSDKTDEATLQTTLELCTRYGKETITAQRDVWCFLSGRAKMGVSMENSIMHLANVADHRTLDAVTRYRIGLPMGEFELLDFTGSVDIRPRSLESLGEILKDYPDFEPWPEFRTAYSHLARSVWADMSARGLSGVKSGQGYYPYPGNKYLKPDIPKELADAIDPVQLIAPGLNCAAWCVTNGVGSVEDINKANRLAFGWPKGIFDYIPDYGIARIIEVLNAKEAAAPDWLRGFYRVDPLLANWPS